MLLCSEGRTGDNNNKTLQVLGGESSAGFAFILFYALVWFEEKKNPSRRVARFLTIGEKVISNRLWDSRV